MINFIINKEDFSGLNLEMGNYNIIKISNNEMVINYQFEIQKLIQYFSKEYKWDLMFTYEDVLKRIENNHLMFLLYQNNQSIGYVFFEPKSEETYHLYNLYVTNIIVREDLSPIWFVNRTISDIFNLCSKVTCSCEDWHKSAHSVFLSNNFSII